MRRIILFFILIILNQCDLADNKLIIFNRSDHPIYYYYSSYNSLKDWHLVENECGNNTNMLASDQYIRQNSKKNITMMGWPNPWEKYVKNCKSKTLYIFIFKEETIKKYSSEFIKRHNLFDKKYEYTLKDLENNNWTIIYK